MARNYAGGIASFIQGYGLGRQLVADWQAGQERQELGKIAEAKPEVSTGYTAEDGQHLEAIAGAKDADGKPYYTLTANEDGSYKVVPNFQVQAADGTMQAAPEATIQQRKMTDFLGKRVDGVMSEDQVNSARQRAMAGVVARRDPAAGARLLDGITSAERDTQRFEWDQANAKRGMARAAQADADNQALRDALSDRENMVGRSSISSGADLGGASNVLEHGPAIGSGRQSSTLAGWDGVMKKEQAQARGGATGGSPDGKPALEDYLKTVAPRAMQELLRQGRVDDAKHLQSFVSTEQGRRYASSWMDGVRRYSIGDHQGAMKSLERLYNDGYDDGQQVKLTPLEDGKSFQAELFDNKGKSLGKQTGGIEALLQQAVVALDPVSAAKFHMQQQGRREAEAATSTRQKEMELLRQEGRSDVEDRRDARQATRLAAQGRKGLTAAQERTNLEIDSARDRIAGMSPEEIRRRTAKATSTGRENKDYDPGLARAAALAARRKVGDDEQFDRRGQGAAPAGGAGQDAAARFRADPKMGQYKLGKTTPKGVEVLDASGKLLGHYR